MKKLKTFISVLLIFSLLPVFPAFAKEEISEAVVLSETEQFKKLSAFGVLGEEASDMEYYSEITRGIFMKYAMKCYFGNGIYPDVQDAEALFSDVSSSTDGAVEISVASKLGIVSGNGNSLFRPDDSITSSEAAKILVSVLGYGEIAENTGGYPTGYLALANKLDIFDGCVFSEEGYMAPADFLLALENTLEAEVMEISAIHSYNPGITRTYTTEDKTLLEYVFDIYMDEGIVESNEYTSIYGSSDVDEGRVKIDDVRYTENGSGAGKLLGYNTEVYYKKDKAEKNRLIVYIAPYENNVVYADSELIEKSLVTATTFGYYKTAVSARASDVKIAKSASLIYNGAQQSLTAQRLCPKNGNVTLIDNNRDNTYDVALVMDYRTILVSGVSASSYSVLDMLGGESIELDPEDEDYDVYITIDGKEGDFASIAAKNVISYAESSGNRKNVKYVNVSTKYIEGTPEAIGDDFVTVNGVDYLVAEEIASTLSLRDSGIFYLDFTGKIVARKTEKDVVYGYLNGVRTDSGMSGSIFVQIFTENNRWVELELKEKINYNDKIQKAELFYNDCMAMGDYRQLITYTVDESGKVNMIRFAQNFEPFSPAEENAIEQDIFRCYDLISSAQYRSALKTLGGNLLLSENTKVFVVPDQTQSKADLEEFYIMSLSEFEADVSYKNIIPYDLDRIRTAGAIVIVGYKKSVSSKSSFMVVDSVVSTLNSENTPVKGIRGYYKNTLITLATKDASVLLDSSGKTVELGKGDVIQFSMDNDGNISSVSLKYDYSAGDKQSVSTSLSYSSNSFVRGAVYYTDAVAGKFISDGGSSKYIIGTDKSTIINIYDTETNTLTPGTISDLENGNKFIARVAYFVADEIVVYR